MRPDWTIAIDDMLCEGFPRCLVCGAAAKRIDLAEVGAQVWAVSRCLRCHDQDPQCLDLDVRLAQRGPSPASHRL
jgi:hypothetical protein